MMIVVKNRRTGETHSGRCPESIARRLYGKRAGVRYSPDPNTPWHAYVTTPGYKGDRAYNVEAEWYLDDEALAAREDPEDRDES